MDNLLIMVLLIAFIFVLTYDPRSRTLDRFISPATGDDACRYQSVQFGRLAESCVMEKPQTDHLGAVIRR